MKFLFNFAIALPIICSQIMALVFIGYGIYETFEGTYGLIIQDFDSSPGLKLINALDLFLFSFLFLIFSLGFSQLFLPDTKFSRALESITPKWLEVENFTQLKLILWETVLTTIVIMFVQQLVKAKGEYSWHLFILPVSIVLISISSYMIRKGENETRKGKEKEK